VARRPEPKAKSRYAARFGTIALILISGTLLLVLYVLPERYVLRPGFRESGIGFPNPSTPFAPYPVIAVAAASYPQPPGPPVPPLVIAPGPAETFWSLVVPLVEGGRFSDALPAFDRYLNEYPTDIDVRRERAVTLLATGDRVAAIGELRRVLGSDEDAELRLLLARTLRELGRIDEAAAEYERLAEARPDDLALTLEWAQAFAWAQRYADAAAVLERALDRSPGSIPLRVELARVYYSGGRLADARDLLAPIGDDELMAANGIALRNDVRAALYVPPPPPPTPLTPLELAVAAREADDFARARTLFEEALRAAPADGALWRAYADLLEYELSDFEGAYAALLELERLRDRDSDVQFRMAQLEIWTGRFTEAEARLVNLLADLDPDAAGEVSRADVHAALGDLRRWQGDRLGAAVRYRFALAADPENERASAGMDAIDAEVRRQLVEVEAPRLGARAYSLADTDDFGRLDLGGDWVDVRDTWVWGGAIGNRWVTGVALDGATADRQGTYAEATGARWWRLGTIRTGVDVGMERLRSKWDPSVAASIGHRGLDGSTSEVRYEHRSAYPIAVTMQSVLADVVHDRVSVSHARPLGETWSVSVTVDAAHLRGERDSLALGSGTSAARFQGALSVARRVSPSLTVGLSTGALVFADAAPVTSLPGGGTQRVFWDPNLVVSAGPYVQLRRDISSSWTLSGRLGPGVALIDERRVTGSDVVPHVSAEAGVRREGARFWTALDVFYYQGQFDGYRTYGARLTLSARDFSSLTPR
jgi:tetratricopeptide (TPR) repeat protein